jgi:hypothetical protein
VDGSLSTEQITVLAEEIRRQAIAFVKAFVDKVSAPMNR